MIVARISCFGRRLLFVACTISASATEPRDISPELETIRARYKLPACAAAVIKDGQITTIGATGLRRADRDVRVTTADLWHIGSCTKSMTATLIGVLVDAGKLRWDTTLPEALPDVPCHPAWRQVTVWHLVTQRSGIGSISREEWQKLDAMGGPPSEQRVNFARLLLAHAPAEPPGKFAYSNMGYGLLGAIIERASGKSYEDFLWASIFVPLGLKTAGFGTPATPGKLDQPWGHRRNGDRLAPVDPTPENQFPPALAPAACVHMSLADFAHYAAWVSTGQPHVVKAGTFAQLQTPPAGSSYAGGLWQSELPGIGGEAVCHTGHLGGFFAVFYAGRHCACVTVFNTEGGGWEWLGDVVAAAALKATP